MELIQYDDISWSIRGLQLTDKLASRKHQTSGRHWFWNDMGPKHKANTKQPSFRWFLSPFDSVCHFRHGTCLNDSHLVIRNIKMPTQFKDLERKRNVIGIGNDEWEDRSLQSWRVSSEIWMSRLAKPSDDWLNSSLVFSNIAVEHHHFWGDLNYIWTMFHSCVSLPVCFNTTRKP